MCGQGFQTEASQAVAPAARAWLPQTAVPATLAPEEALSETSPIDAVPAPRKKPRLRGVSHEIAFYVSILAGCVLTAWARPGKPSLAAMIYTGCVTVLFGASALYHRPNWLPATRAMLRRVDHAAIYLLIAGTYTPVALLAVPGDAGMRLLALAWGGAVLGVGKSLLWPNAPKPVSAALYVLMGWLVVAEWSAVARGLGTVGLGLLLVGGVLYTAGAIIYAKRRPDPSPGVFGYHEIFHALVVAAAGLHFAAVARVVAAADIG